ncbi:hypothetical protein B296_00044677 [Ensete ventricosum]|uniref:Uncharacterized protein n=1 Tax=Ensete ventricosum TaxID=4639 RepID=A0A426Y269_ENSVE|nr:hypothetical protein B296_00044677 [Ensete ventricosum]
MVGLGRNKIVGIRITDISKSWLEMVGAIVVARSCSGGSKEVQRQRRGWKWLWHDGCDYGEEVGQHWIWQLAAVVVEMQGKEGMIENKRCSGRATRRQR